MDGAHARLPLPIAGLAGTLAALVLLLPTPPLQPQPAQGTLWQGATAGAAMRTGDNFLSLIHI
eukprot:6259961-Prorocentrum_lima.AAC.1